MKIDPNRSIGEYHLGTYGYVVSFKNFKEGDNNSPRIPYIIESTIVSLVYPDQINLIDNKINSSIVYLTYDDAHAAAIERHQSQLNFLHEAFKSYESMNIEDLIETETKTDREDDLAYITTSVGAPTIIFEPTEMPKPKFSLGQEVWGISTKNDESVRMSGYESKICYQIIHATVTSIDVVGLSTEKKVIRYMLSSSKRIEHNQIFATYEEARIVREELIKEQIDYFQNLLQNEQAVDERLQNKKEIDCEDLILTQDEVNSLLGFDK